MEKLMAWALQQPGMSHVSVTATNQWQGADCRPFYRISLNYFDIGTGWTVKEGSGFSVEGAQQQLARALTGSEG